MSVTSRFAHVLSQIKQICIILPLLVGRSSETQLQVVENKNRITYWERGKNNTVSGGDVSMMIMLDR